MSNFNSHKKVMLTIAGLLVLCLSLSSCDTLRQKFTRHKKKGDIEDQTFVPVLEPEEYPTIQEDPERNYKEQYSMIKAWYQDLWTALNDKNSPGYIHYTIKEIINHITQMEKLVDVPTQENLVKLASFLDYYNISLDSSWDMRNTSRIQSDLRAFDRFLRDHLRIDKIKGHLVSATGTTSSK